MSDAEQPNHFVNEVLHAYQTSDEHACFAVWRSCLPRVASHYSAKDHSRGSSLMDCTSPRLQGLQALERGLYDSQVSTLQSCTPLNMNKKEHGWQASWMVKPACSQTQAHGFDHRVTSSQFWAEISRK